MALPIWTKNPDTKKNSVLKKCWLALYRLLMFQHDRMEVAMININSLPETGFLSIDDIVCRPEITQERSAATYRALEDAKARGDAKAIEKARFNVRKPRCATRGLLPISKSTWLNGVKTGKYPKPVRLGPKTRVWRVADIIELINSLSQS